MALADRRVEPDTRNRFEKWLDSLNAKNKATVTSWLLDVSISNQSIVEWIRDDDPEDSFEGYRANRDTISAWRRAHGNR